MGDYTRTELQMHLQQFKQIRNKLERTNIWFAAAFCASALINLVFGIAQVDAVPLLAGRVFLGASIIAVLFGSVFLRIFSVAIEETKNEMLERFGGYED